MPLKTTASPTTAVPRPAQTKPPKKTEVAARQNVSTPAQTKGWVQPNLTARTSLPQGVDAPSVVRASTDGNPASGLPPGVARPPLPPGVPDLSAPLMTRPLQISHVLQTYGWGVDSWQARFLMSADKADKGTRAQGKQGDGMLTVAELRDFAYHPTGGRFLTSLALEQVAAEAGSGKPIAQLSEAWMRDVAKNASKKGGTVTAADINAYAAKVAAGTSTDGAEWVTNQRVQVLYHSLARLSNESDAMDSPTKLKGTELIYPAMTLAYDAENNVAITASNTYFAADEKLSVKTERSDKFYNSIDGAGVNASVFSGPSSMGGRTWFDLKDFGRGKETYDKGHYLANLNFNNPRDRATSFATQNMHAQVPASNSGVWLRKVEMATRASVVAANGRAVDVTGVLFVDKNFKQLPADKIPWISGSKGVGDKASFGPGARVPVPSHTWKAVLLQTGDNPPKFSARCFIVENNINLDRSSEPKIVSLKEMERILGGNVRLFQDLPADVRAKIDSDPNAVFQPAQKLDFIAATEFAQMA